MKRIVLLLSILFMLTLTGCSLLGPHTETDYPAAKSWQRVKSI